MTDFCKLIDHLAQTRTLPDEDLLALLACTDPDVLSYLSSRADAVRREFYGNDVYIRGLVEFSSYCKNDCLYCGLRRSNKNAERYRLTPEDASYHFVNRRDNLTLVLTAALAL